MAYPYRFGQVDICTALVTAYFVCCLFASSNHDDARIGQSQPEPAGEAEAIFARQVQVHDQQVKARKHIVEFFRTRKSHSMVTLLIQDFYREVTQVVVVFNHQNIQAGRQNSNLTNFSSDAYLKCPPNWRARVAARYRPKPEPV